MFKLIATCILLMALICHINADAVSTIIDCKRPNEEYQCGSACQTTCENIGQPCPIVNIRCNDDCYCIKGYARDSTGKCIPIANCPKKTYG